MNVTSEWSGFASWLSYGILIPALGVLLMYPINAWVLNSHEPFVHSFATAEPILLAAFTLLGVGADVGQHNVFSSKKSIRLMVMQHLCILVAVGWLLSYGFIKSSAQTLLFTPNLSAESMIRLHGFSAFGVAALIFSIALAIWAKAFVVYQSVSIDASELPK